MTASEIEGHFATLFSNKLKGRPFNFVRAVGNKIVDVNLAQVITGKILEHICGQGPVYLRCVRPTDTEYAWVEEEEDSYVMVLMKLMKARGDWTIFPKVVWVVAVIPCLLQLQLIVPMWCK